MDAQGGLLLATHSSQRVSSSRMCSDYEENWVYQSLIKFAIAPPLPLAPPRRRATTSTYEPEMARSGRIWDLLIKLKGGVYGFCGV